MIDPVPSRSPMPVGPDPEARLRAVAEDLEAAFLAEMLAATGLGEMPEGFGGGIGEEQFASMLRQEQARLLAANGGIGLAESIYAALVEKADG